MRLHLRHTDGLYLVKEILYCNKFPCMSDKTRLVIILVLLLFHLQPMLWLGGLAILKPQSSRSLQLRRF